MDQYISPYARYPMYQDESQNSILRESSDNAFIDAQQQNVTTRRDTPKRQRAPKRNQEFWEQHRSVIERLYLDEDRELKEVMDFMERRHGLVGSIKQYKTQMTKWNIRKYVKKEEAIAILRKKRNRDVVGTKSTFSLRGKPVDMNNVLRYLGRKGISDGDVVVEDAPTPPALECKTPVATPPSSPVPKSLDLREFKTGTLSGYDMCSLQPSSTKSYSMYQTPDDLRKIGDHDSSIAVCPTPTRCTNSSTRRKPSRVNSRRLSMLVVDPQLQYPLCPPSDLRITEKLLFNVNRFILASFDPNFNQRNANNPPTGPHHQLYELTDFQYLWVVGCQLMKSNQYIESRRVFSQLFDLIMGLLTNNDPQVLWHMLYMHIHIRRELPELARLLRRHISELASTILPSEHPWRGIISTISDMNDQILEQNLLESWSMIIGQFSGKLDRLHEQYLACYSTYLRGLVGETKREQLFSQLVEGTALALAHSESATLYLRFRHATLVFEIGDYHRTSISLRQIRIDAKLAGDESTEMNSLLWLARCQYEQGSYAGAEDSLREAITMAKHYGRANMLVRIGSDLQRVLTIWGRYEEVRVLQDEMNALLSQRGTSMGTGVFGT